MADMQSFLRSEPATDLLRAPVLSQTLIDQDPGFTGNTGHGLSLLANICQSLGLLWTASTKTTIPRQFATDGRFVDVQYLSDLVLRVDS